MQNNSLSIVIIGKNEGWKISKCFDSLFLTLKVNKIKSYEIIFIDSGSTDDTIQRVKSFKNVNIFVVPKDSNSAIARNIGVKESKGDVIFFIDGDMEIIPDSLINFYSEENGLVSEFISGNFENYFYSLKNELIYTRNHYNLNSDTFQITTGGLFLVTRRLWEKVGGMRIEFRRSQDLDFGLRMAKIGYPLLRKNVVLAKHHTTDYYNYTRIFKDATKGNYLYKGLLYKKNLSNKHIYNNYIKKEISLISLVITLIIIFTLHNPYFLFIYPMILSFKVVLKRSIFRLPLPIQFFFYILTDTMTLFSILFFWPHPKNNPYYYRVTYDTIN